MCLGPIGQADEGLSSPVTQADTARELGCEFLHFFGGGIAALEEMSFFLNPDAGHF